MAGKPLDLQNLTRSCNEALILAALSEGSRHGYQLVLDIAERSEGMFQFKHGTLYPILHKLEKDGLIAGEWAGESGSRKRKSYALTAGGRRRLAEQRGAWRAFAERFFDLVGESGP